VPTMAIFPRVKQAVGATDSQIYIATRLKMNRAVHYTCTLPFTSPRPCTQREFIWPYQSTGWA
jgi:hypothetical protein